MAVTATRRGSNALADIVGWCGELPGWQQDALRRIVEGRDLTTDDISELTLLCKRAHGMEVEDAPELRPLNSEHVPKGIASKESMGSGLFGWSLASHGPLYSLVVQVG